MHKWQESHLCTKQPGCRCCWHGTRLSVLPVCTAATATIVNGASRLHNSVSVVQWLIHLRAACEHCMLVEHNNTQREGRGCGKGEAGRPWAMQT